MKTGCRFSAAVSLVCVHPYQTYQVEKPETASTAYRHFGLCECERGKRFLQITCNCESSQQADLFSRLLTADNQTVLMDEGSRLDQISKTHLWDKRAAAAKECQLGEIYLVCNYWWNISDRHPSCCWVTAHCYHELYLGFIREHQTPTRRQQEPEASF